MQQQLVSIFSCRDFEVHRHAQPGTNLPTVPEQVTLRQRHPVLRDVVLSGQDAADLLDQLTHARDVRHMADVCRDAWDVASA